MPRTTPASNSPKAWPCIRRLRFQAGTSRIRAASISWSGGSARNRSRTTRSERAGAWPKPSAGWRPTSTTIRSEPASALLGAAGRDRLPFLVLQMHADVVERNEQREEVRDDADRVVLAEDEVGQQQHAAAYRQVPERHRHHHLLVPLGGVELHEPARGEGEGADEADQLPRRDLEIAQGVQDVFHGALR